MLKPVSLLALDEPSVRLASAVQQRVTSATALDDLVQWRAVMGGANVAETVASIHARRQAPDSPLRLRDDVSARELVMLVVSAGGEQRDAVLQLGRDIRALYEMRRLASYFTIEVLCLLPDVAAPDYGAAYSLLKRLAADEAKTFHEVWLLDAINAHRVKFGPLDKALDVYAEAVAGSLLFEPELSGAIPGIHPRGMHPTFSSFGFAELLFDRAAALQRLESRFAAELLTNVLLRPGETNAPAALHAKQLVIGDPFAKPLARIGVDSGQSLFRRFQPKTMVTETTRSADELIAAVRGELKTHRDSVQMQNLDTLAKQSEQTANELAALVTRTVDETLDRDEYDTATRLVEALIDPLPDLRSESDLAPRNLITEIGDGTAALDARLQFAPNVAASSAARKRARELQTLIQEQQVVAESLNAANAASQLAALEHERDHLIVKLPELLFAEEAENNAARNTARENEANRLKDETLAREQRLRELFAQKPHAEEALREALETRRRWCWRQTLWGVIGVALLYAVPLAFDRVVTWQPLAAAAAYTLWSLLQYAMRIAPPVRAARERLARLIEQIEVTDRSKNAAHNDELQFEYDIAHRRATLNVLRRTREHAKKTLDQLRARAEELETLAASFVPQPIVSGGLTINLVDDEDVDRWYAATDGNRKPHVREFPISRSESLRRDIDELRGAVVAYASTAFESFRAMTLAQAASLPPEAMLAHRLKRFAEYSAPLIELRDEDVQAQQAMQRDTTLWLDPPESSFATQLRRRLGDAHIKPGGGALRAVTVTRVLHYPAYVLGQIDYYRAQCTEADDVPDLIPTELVLTGAMRTAYEQVLLARAFGMMDVESNLAAAQQLAASSTKREELERALEPRLQIMADVERDLEKYRDALPAASMERDVIAGMLKRYRS